MPIVKTKEELEKYKKFLENNPYASMPQDPSWGNVKANWSKDLVYIEDNNKEIEAALSVIGIQNDKADGYFLYAPRGPVCDFKDVKLVKRLIKEAEVLKDKYNAFLLRLDPEFRFDEKTVIDYRKEGFSFRSFGDDIKSFTQPRYNMILDLKGHTKESLLESFSSKCRYNVRKSYREGVITKIVTPNEESISDFYHLTEIMAKRQSIGHRDLSYFKRLCDYFDCVFVESRFEDELLCACLLIKYNTKLYYLYAASSNEKRNLMPNHNMIWTALEYALDNGFTSFDFGGVFSLDKSNGLYRFKEGFCYPDNYTNFIGELDVVYDSEKYQLFLK